MLSVGREINVAVKRLLCRECWWEGVGRELSAGLVRIACSNMFLYCYRCPRCESYDLAEKGKLLSFVPRLESPVIQSTPGSDEAADLHTIQEQQTWKGGRLRRLIRS
jgi:hypothetical protein